MLDIDDLNLSDYISNDLLKDHSKGGKKGSKSYSFKKSGKNYSYSSSYSYSSNGYSYSSSYFKGGNGNDYLKSGNGDDKLYGGNGDDKLYSGNGNDKLYGGNGNDKLYGGNGNDYLTGGKGNDKLYGGKGADTFVFYNQYEKIDVVKDFHEYEGDIIKINKQGFGASSIDDFQYNDRNGALSFDGIKFAILEGAPNFSVENNIHLV